MGLVMGQPSEALRRLSRVLFRAEHRPGLTGPERTVLSLIAEAVAEAAEDESHHEWEESMGEDL